MLSVCCFVRADRIDGLQPRSVQQLLKFFVGNRILHVVDGLEIQTLLGQDPLDLAALRSRRFLVDDDPVGFHSVLLAKEYLSRQA